MQAVLAVADVPHPGVGSGDGPQALGKENSIWIHLGDPIVLLVPAVVDDPLPDFEKEVRLCRGKIVEYRDEDPGVEGRVRVAPELDREVCRHYCRPDAWAHRERDVAVDIPSVAAEDADSFLVLELQQLLLVGVRDHQGEAKHRPAQRFGGHSSRGVTRRRSSGRGNNRKEGWTVRRQAGHKAGLRLLACRQSTLQPALAGAAIQTGVLHPRPRLALHHALAHGAAHLGVRNVVQAHVPSTFHLVLHVFLHLAALAWE
mmetsp:Transcript_14703/g.40368  ORF Transcript_14703/g.40368 Transcript_14703/m.40368 type:complete len:258 (+) Transcript_14703:476-1249(+)